MKPKAKRIVEKIKDRKSKDQKINVTFRVPESLYKSFKSKCQKLEISTVDAVRGLMEEFLE